MTMTDRQLVTRRAALRTFGIGAGVIGAGMVFGLPTAAAQAAPPLTVDAWKAARGAHYYIAHRGSGDVLPEHSMEAYQAAVAWGAQCLEISVGMTSDGVLICMHDSTYDRTTTGSGKVRKQPSSVLETIRIWQPRLGAAWTVNPPRVPLFEDVVAAFGGKVILAVEAKSFAAYDPIMALIDKYGLHDSIIVKMHFRSSRVEKAQAAGYPVFSYFGAPGEVTPAAVATAAARLNPARDYLVLPAFGVGPEPFIDSSILAGAVATGIPVWVHPLHRRSEAERFFALGVQGAICSSYGYIANSAPLSKEQNWKGRAIEAGEMTRMPSSDSYAPRLRTNGQLVLALGGAQHFITMGQLGPLAQAAGDYRIDVDLSWETLPGSAADNMTVAFGREDDRYYEHRLGRGTGYHAILRANGALGLYLHTDGQTDGTLLASAWTPALAPGQWAHLSITVAPDRITVSRTDVGVVIEAADSTVRGGYLHLGRSSKDGVACFGTLLVS